VTHDTPPRESYISILFAVYTAIDSSIQVDIHAIWFTKTGIPMYGPTDKAVEYPDLSGRGAIAGLPVKCTTAQSIVEGRTGFTLRGRDVHDVALLCARFGIPMPDDYSRR